MRGASLFVLIGLLASSSTTDCEALATDTENYLAQSGDDVEIRCPAPSLILQRRFNDSCYQCVSLNGNDTSSRVIRNVTLDDSGYYDCRDENGVLTNEICLNVTDIPRKPHNISCITEPFLEYMKCCWNVSRSTGIPTTYYLNYTQKFVRYILQKDYYVLKREVCQTVHYPANCQQGYMLPMQCCDIKTGYNRSSVPQRDGYIYFELMAKSKNSLGSSSPSDHSDFKHYPSAHVKPDSPQNVRASAITKGQYCILTVEWDLPDMADVHMTYAVRYRKDGGPWKILEYTHDNSMNFTLRNSYRDVDVQVVAFPSGKDSFSGSCSDWSKITEVSLWTQDQSYNTAVLTSVVPTGIAVAMLTLALVYRWRKKLKPCLVGASNRRLPSPNVFVPLDRVIYASTDQRHVIEDRVDAQASDADDFCLREESFTEIKEPLLSNQDSECDGMPKYALGNALNTTAHNDTKSTYSNDELETASTTASRGDATQIQGSLSEGSMVSPSDGNNSSGATSSAAAGHDCDESGYACSYSTVPGYLSCTTPQQQDENQSSSVETLTDYASFFTDP